MSDFYGLHLIDTIPKNNHPFTAQFNEISSYNSGHRIGEPYEDESENIINPQIRLGGGP